MSENKPTYAPITPTETAQREASAIQTIVSSIVAEQRQSWMSEMKAELDALREPIRTNVPELVNREGETVHRLTSPTEYMYSRMTEAERQWRNPDSDHHMAEWLRGCAGKDNARMFQANVALEAMYGRATTEEGVAAASGGLSTGTGGSLIPRPLEAVILIARDRVAKMRRFAGGFTMTAQTHTVPTAKSMTAHMTLEGVATTQGEPTYASIQLTARKNSARGIVTNEVLADAAVNVVNVMSTRAGSALGAVEEAQMWRIGEGTAPNITAFMAGVALAETTSGILDFTTVIAAYYAVPQQYRDNARWFAASDVLQLMALVRDGNGRSFYPGLLEPSLPLGDDGTAFQTILGKPVHEVDATPGTIHFADASALYLVGSRAGITARTSEHVGFTTGTVQFIWEERFDGTNVDTSAGQTITGITSANSL